MREIKFRAWVSDLGAKHLRRMVRVNTLSEYQVCFHEQVMGEYCQRRGDVILMQYTGLKDKNGIEIYEGDIVNVTMNYADTTLPHMGEIVYDEEFGAFATKNLSGKTLLHNHCLHTLKIIGNIYQNKELLNANRKSNKDN